jgi:hypothetical protein
MVSTMNNIEWLSELHVAAVASPITTKENYNSVVAGLAACVLEMAQKDGFFVAIKALRAAATAQRIHTSEMEANNRAVIEAKALGIKW